MVRLRSQSDSFSGGINEALAASTAAGGTALSTTAVLIALLNGTTHASLIAWNFLTAVVTRYALNPYIAVLFNNDALATDPVDNSDAANDGLSSTNVTVSALTTLALGGAIYIGSHVPFRGLRAVSVGANGNASVLTVKYWNGTAWTDISASDGTATGGKTFAQSGDITWTVPTAWAKQTLRAILQSLTTSIPCGQFSYDIIPLYWLRLEVSAVLSATVTMSSLMALNRSTAYAEMLEGGLFQARVSKGVGGVASVEALCDAGTANLIVNCYNEPGGSF